MTTPNIAMAYTDEAEKAYTAVEDVASERKNSDALMFLSHAENVPGVMRGEFAVTGGKRTVKSGNLAHALAVLATTTGATTVWHETTTGRKRVVRL